MAEKFEAVEMDRTNLEESEAVQTPTLQVDRPETGKTRLSFGLVSYVKKVRINRRRPQIWSRSGRGMYEA